MSVVLVTGGAGSLGKVLCQKLLNKGHHVRCMDINESALASMSYDPKNFTKIYGDISNYHRVFKAMRGVDIVYHCAAMKNILITEWNAPDCVRINVLGTQNVAEAAIERRVKHAIFISSDKAVEPSTLYGSTKQTGEHLWKAAGRIQQDTIFTIVRSGNFFESNGNVLEIWASQKKQGKPLTLTHIDMERFFIEVEDLADIILELPIEQGTFIPMMKEYNLLTLMISLYGDEQEYIITGIRQGEKMREKLMSDGEEIIEVRNDYWVVR